MKFDKAPTQSLWQKLRHRSSAVDEPLSSSPDVPPKPWHCFVHLRLMRAFSRLRENLLDRLLPPHVLDSLLSGLAEDERASVEAKIQDQIWHTYLQKAATRFETWWRSIASKGKQGPLSCIDMSILSKPGKLEQLLQQTIPRVWSEIMLPPIDVLLILHGFMLQPRCFFEDCIRYQMLHFWKGGIALAHIHHVIQDSTYEYTVPEATQKNWTERTGRPWDIHEDPDGHVLVCPLCSASIIDGAHQEILNGKFTSVEHILFPSSISQCPECNTSLSDDRLKVHKLYQLVRELRRNNAPMPGTILTANGLAQSALSSSASSKTPDINQILCGPLGEQVVSMTSPQPSNEGAGVQLSEVQAMMENSSLVRGQKDIEAAVRLLFFYLAESHSIFMLDLPAAVLRQGVYINVMEGIDWLHSPAIMFTLNDLLQRYVTFFQIMKENKSSVAVPTYAVDLAWHTHQLLPVCYYEFSLNHANGIFIDHDDRIENQTRTDAFARTSEHYKRLNDGKDYSECLCWYCATAHDMTADSKVHLSIADHGHVAVDSGTVLDKAILEKVAIKQFEKFQEDYDNACSRSAILHQSAPSRSEFAKSYRWLYLRAIPIIKD